MPRAGPGTTLATRPSRVDGIVEGGVERVPRSPSFIALIVLGFAAAGCRENSPHAPDDLACTAQFVFGLSVTVQGVDSGQRICDAEVIAVEGSYHETLRSFGPSESCTYPGAGERPGVYEIRASKEGFRLATVADVRVGSDPCHVIPVPVTLVMAR
jgi:hypothetical protein